MSWAPVLMGDLSDQEFELDKEVLENKFEILIPDAFDGDGDSTVINFESETLGSISSSDETMTSEYMNFDNETNILSISVPMGQIEDFEGDQEIVITLSDEIGLFTEYTQLITFVNLQKEQVVENEFVFDVSSFQEEEEFVEEVEEETVV